jgi:hypothetical protein
MKENEAVEDALRGTTSEGGKLNLILQFPKHS